MARTVWKLISQYGLEPSPHLPDVRGLALAEVDRDGILRYINRLGREHWEWKRGERLPVTMLSALQALSALDAVQEGAAQALPMQKGGLALVGVSLRPESGWLIVGHPSRRRLLARASTFRSLIEKVPVLKLRMRGDGTVVEAGSEAEQVTGYAVDQITGRPFWLEVVHPEDRWKLTEALRRAWGGRTTAVTVRFLSPRQEIRLADLHLLAPERRDTEELRLLALDVTEQHDVEAALLQSEALYRTFLEQSPMGVLHLDKRGIVTFENHPFRQIVGEAVEDAWIGRRIDHIAGLDSETRSLLRQMLEDGTLVRSEPATYQRRGGERDERHLLVHASPIRQPGDVIVGGVVMIEDVTEQRRREEELKLRDRYVQAEAALRKAVLADPNLKTTAFLHRAAAILGTTTRADRVHLLTRQEVKGLCTTQAVWARTSHERPRPLQLDPDQYPSLQTGIDRHRSLYLHRDRTRKADQDLLDLTDAAEAIWAPFYNADQAAGVVVLERTALLPDAGTRFWPRTELHLINQLIRLFEALWVWVQVGQRYRMTIATIDDCLFTFACVSGGRRRYLFITPQVEQLTGYTAEALRTPDGLDWVERLVHEADREQVRAHEAALCRGEESAATFRVEHRDGTVRWLREHGHPVRDMTGQVNVSGILMDVTEQKEAESMLRRAKEEAESQNRLKSAFVATMSHELRTPLGAINGFADLLSHELSDWEAQSGQELPEEVYEFTEAVQQNAQRLLALADDLSVLSNLELGGVQIEKRAVPLHDLLRQEAGKIAFTLSEKNVDLRAELDPSHPRVQGDPHRVQQVLRHLLRNAAKFTDEGLVQIRTQRANGEVMVEVADTGVGIAEDHLEALFEPFRQEDNRLNRKYEGTGLGLALVKRLLDLMDGRITVESEKGLGSTFRVFLPAVAEEG
ncbi:MAG: PAS domain S-box protein [Bacteroidetes bacterium]|jgi:PAS domain S-box-containing protein|nr:PAS domain S-box protein [Bacteroidota bacterium]